MVFALMLSCLQKASAQTPAYVQTFDNYFNNNLSAYNNRVTVVIGCPEGILYSYNHGFNSNTLVSVQSISKWLTSAVIMTLEEEGKLDLDDKVGQYISSWNGNGKQNVTIRQILAHTSRIVDGTSWDSSTTETLEQAVDKIATQTTLMPGSGFSYGSTSYKVASRVAEVVEGKAWKTIFDERFKTVCGMGNSVYSPNSIDNPATGRGLLTSLSEYSNFLRMILRYGMHNSTRVMDSASIVAIEAESSYDGQPFITYGLGVWREQVTNGVAKEVWHNGVDGALAWVDRNRGYFGLIITDAGMDANYSVSQTFRRIAGENIPNNSCGSVTPPSCNFNLTASNSVSGSNLNLSSSCSGADCGGVTYAWSGNGASGSSSSTTVTKPTTPGTYTYTITASKSGCSDKTATTTYTVSNGGNPCGFTDKQTIGTWTTNSYLLQARQYTVNGTTQWLIVTVDPASTVDRHFPRGANFITRTDLSWNSGSAPSQSCFGGGETGYGGLVIPSNITTPSGYTTGTTEDGANYFIQTGGCTNPAAPTLSASPSTITTSGGSSTLTASGCSGGTITWSDGLGTGTSKSVTPTSTKTYYASCSIGGCTSSDASVVVTVDIPPPSGVNCNTLSSDVNGANCLFIEGWIYDASNPNTPVSIDIYDGSTLIISNYSANKFRQDLLNAGMGNGNHAFEINTPASLRDGQSHTLHFKASACNYTLNNSPRILSGCSNAVVDMTGADGWANQKLNMVVSPNPSKGIFETSFYLEKGKKATLVVTDLQGRIIYRQSVTGQGIHKERINLSNKASGTLLLQLQKSNGTEVKKINIAR